MVNQLIIEILVRKIKNGEINPKTNLPMMIDDIKIEEYKTAVKDLLGYPKEITPVK